jgi:hypothetical protein
MKDLHIASYIGGIDRSTSRNKYKNTNYHSASNFDIITNEDNTAGALVNSKGNKLKLQVNLIDSQYYFIGYCLVRESVVLFYHAPSSQKKDVIFLLNSSDFQSDNLINLDKSNIIYRENLGYNKDTVIDAIGRYENEELQKVYFCGSKTALRVINIKDPLLLNKSTELLNVIPGVNHTPIEIDSIIQGAIKAGSVQYAYQLYNLNGAETSFSPASNIVPIYDRKIGEVYTRTQTGSNIGESTNTGVKIKIDNLDERFNRIRIVRLLYQDINIDPEITIIHEGDVSLNFVFSDFGNANLGNYTIQEFRELLINPSPESIETKNNYLFLANVKEDEFDFEYNARAKRYLINSGNTYNTEFNPYNDLSNDFVGGNNFVYQISGNRHGGVGENISYQFKTKDFLLDEGISKIVTNSNLDYSNPEFAAKYRGYARDEIYRYGLVGFKKGRPSFVKYIDDIRFPDFKDSFSYSKKDYSVVNPGQSAIKRIRFTRTDNDYTKTRTFQIVVNGFTFDFSWIGTFGAITRIAAFNASVTGLTASLIGNDLISIYSSNTLFSLNSIEVVFAIKSSIFPSVTNPPNCINQIFIVQDYIEPVYDFTETIESTNANLLTSESYQLNSTTYYKTFGRILYPSFNVKNIPGDIDSFQIVRVKRDRENRTVIDSGYIGNMPRKTDGDDIHYRFFDGYQNTYFASTNLNPEYPHDILDYNSPELLFNKLTEGGDEIEYIGYSPNSYTGEYISFNVAQGTINTRGFSKSTIHKFMNFTSQKIRVKYDDFLLKPYIKNKNARFTIGGRTIKNESLYTFAGEDNLGIRGTCGIYKMNPLDIPFKKINSQLGKPTPNPIGDSFGFVFARRRKFLYPYGGKSLNSVNQNIYIPCSDLIKRGDFRFNGQLDIDCFNGDVFISYMEHAYTLWDITTGENGRRTTGYILLPVESTINTSLVSNPTHNSLYVSPAAQADQTYSAMQETPGEHEHFSPNKYIQDYSLYTYNSSYSKENDSKIFFGKPFDFKSIKNNDTRVYRSDKKINNEQSDSWLKIRPNNFIDVDTKYGSITKLHNFNDNILFFQKNSVGVLFIEQRELMQSQSISSIVTGTGGVLDGYHYISTYSGTSNRLSICNSNNALYYIDDINKKICIVGENIQYLSDIKNIDPIINKLNFDKIISGFSSKMNRVFFTIDNKTIFFNEYTQAFVSFMDFVPNRYMHTDGVMMSFEHPIIPPPPVDDSPQLPELAGRGYKHDVGIRGQFYGKTNPSKITIIINPKGDTTCRFDIAEFILDVVDADYNGLQGETLTSIRVYNDYQDTGKIILSPENNITQRFRTWRMNTIIDKFDEDESRIKSPFVFVDLEYQNTIDNKRISLHDLHIKYFIPKPH